MTATDSEHGMFGLNFPDAESKRKALAELQEKLDKVREAERKAYTDPNYIKPLGATANTQLIRRGEQ